MPQIRIKIRPANDSVLEIELDPEITKVSDLKKLIAEKRENSEPEKQRLIYSGRILKSESDNDKLLSEYNINNDCTIHLVVSKKDSGKPATSSAAPTGGASTQRTSATSPSPSANAPYADPSQQPGGFNPFGSMFGPGGGLGSQGMPPNMSLETAQQMLDNPMFQQTMQQLSSNPELLRTMLDSHPALRSMPEETRRMMLNPDMLRLITNPDVMRTMARLQSGMGPGGLAGSQAVPPTSTDASSPPASGAGANPFDPAAFQNLMSSLGSFPAATQPPAAAPLTTEQQRERYRTELSQLNDMGFFDEAQNLRALSVANGNVNAAVEYLLSHPI
ncbi:hypothetical protein H4219_002690 [Mycoemilia scoparia]|uniref:Uncharacterized protein n=1 Tax=Mycoemilia scoparia TaxID=417184 RepID=A0A9W8DTQ4_9FUNG|nr:hypothetical protein H4219_002690 [Mycoemilia scoparia]